MKKTLSLFEENQWEKIIITLIYFLWSASTQVALRLGNVNMEKYESKYEMLNKVATEYCIYGEYGDGFGKPRNAFFTPREVDDLHHLNQAGKSENLILGRSDFKLGEFKFTEFLDCKHIHRNTDLQARLSEQVFVHNNTLGPGTGYTPHQLVLGMNSGVPGIYEVPESDSPNLLEAWSESSQV